MPRSSDTSLGTPLRILLVAAVVAVLLPTCAAILCEPMSGMHMSGGIGSLVDCQLMYFPSDAPSAVAAEALVLLFVALFAMLVVANSAGMLRVSPVSTVAFDVPPEPSGDPLKGRLII